MKLKIQKLWNKVRGLSLGNSSLSCYKFTPSLLTISSPSRNERVGSFSRMLGLLRPNLVIVCKRTVQWKIQGVYTVHLAHDNVSQINWYATLKTIFLVFSKTSRLLVEDFISQKSPRDKISYRLAVTDCTLEKDLCKTTFL